MIPKFAGFLEISEFLETLKAVGTTRTGETTIHKMKKGAAASLAAAKADMNKAKDENATSPPLVREIESFGLSAHIWPPQDRLPRGPHVNLRHQEPTCCSRHAQ